MKEIFNNNKFQILKEKDCLFLRYDGGQIASDIREIKITESEAQEIVSQGNGSFGSRQLTFVPKEPSPRLQ